MTRCFLGHPSYRTHSMQRSAIGGQSVGIAAHDLLLASEALQLAFTVFAGFELQ